MLDKNRNLVVNLDFTVTIKRVLEVRYYLSYVAISLNKAVQNTQECT